MKSLRISCLIATCSLFGISSVNLFAAPSFGYPDGLFLDDSAWNAYIESYDNNPSSRSIKIAAETGGIMLYSGADETSPGINDGGVTIGGNPVAVVLSSVTDDADADFNVWNLYQWAGNGIPLLNINGLSGHTTFTYSHVAINNGSLKVDGSPVVTSSILTSGGYVNTSNFNSTLSAATPPTSSAWTAAFIPRGNVAPVGGSVPGLLAIGEATASGGKSLASGAASAATGANSIALGYAAKASGLYAVALGSNPNSSGDHTFAAGGHTVASGFASMALGYGASSSARAELAVGTWNVASTPATGTETNGLNGLFRVGNGTSTTLRSDAVTVLMNGQTSLTNKEWKAAVMAAPGNPAAALSDPASTTDSSGNALVVDGHAVLNGKVTLAVPQGDISMGDYQ